MPRQPGGGAPTSGETPGRPGEEAKTAGPRAKSGRGFPGAGPLGSPPGPRPNPPGCRTGARWLKAGAWRSGGPFPQRCGPRGGGRKRGPRRGCVARQRRRVRPEEGKKGGRLGGGLENAGAKPGGADPGGRVLRKGKKGLEEEITRPRFLPAWGLNSGAGGGKRGKGRGGA